MTPSPFELNLQTRGEAMRRLSSALAVAASRGQGLSHRRWLQGLAEEVCDCPPSSLAIVLKLDAFTGRS
jgi:hypothetical protein